MAGNWNTVWPWDMPVPVLSYSTVGSCRNGATVPRFGVTCRCFFPSKVIFSEVTLFYAPSAILAVNLKGSGISQPVFWLDCGMDGRIFGFRFSQRARTSSFLQTFHTSHPSASYSVVMGTISGGWERPVYAADVSTPASTAVKSEWSCTSISSHALMVWYVGKHRATLLLPLLKKTFFEGVARSNRLCLARF